MFNKKLKKKLETAKHQMIQGDFSTHPFNVAKKIQEEIESNLLNELESLEDKETKKVFYDHSYYSVNDLIDAVKNGDDLGNQLVRMMLSLIKWRKRNVGNIEKFTQQNSNSMEDTDKLV